MHACVPSLVISGSSCHWLKLICGVSLGRDHWLPHGRKVRDSRRSQIHPLAVDPSASPAHADQCGKGVCLGYMLQLRSIEGIEADLVEKLGDSDARSMLLLIEQLLNRCLDGSRQLVELGVSLLQCVPGEDRQSFDGRIQSIERAAGAARSLSLVLMKSETDESGYR